MRFIDTNILVYAFYENEFQSSCQKVLEEGGIINTVNLIEAFYALEKIIGRKMTTIFIKGLLKSNLTIIDVDINVFFEALKRSENYKTTGIFDLIHYSTALLTGCESIISNDEDFDVFELKREAVN